MKKLTNLGAGEIENCITNMQMERLASPFGPTNGKILRPSDGNAPRKVAFVQCAGSRDENHLHYCSYICCMASLKQAQYVREQYPDAEVTIYYIDLRTPGRYENFARKILSDENVHAVKGKVAAVTRDKAGDDVWVIVEDAVSGAKSVERFDLVVLATGMRPSLADSPLPLDISMDAEGFIQDGGGKGKSFFLSLNTRKSSKAQNSTELGVGCRSTFMSRCGEPRSATMNSRHRMTMATALNSPSTRIFPNFW